MKLLILAFCCITLAAAYSYPRPPKIGYIPPEPATRTTTDNPGYIYETPNITYLPPSTPTTPKTTTPKPSTPTTPKRVTTTTTDHPGYKYPKPEIIFEETRKVETNYLPPSTIKPQIPPTPPTKTITTYLPPNPPSPPQPPKRIIKQQPPVTEPPQQYLPPGYHYPTPDKPFEDHPEPSTNSNTKYLPPTTATPPSTPKSTPKAPQQPPKTPKLIIKPQKPVRKVDNEYLPPTTKKPLKPIVVLPSSTPPPPPPVDLIPEIHREIITGTKYLPPKPLETKQDDGYHYDAPSVPFLIEVG